MNCTVATLLQFCMFIHASNFSIPESSHIIFFWGNCLLEYRQLELCSYYFTAVLHFYLYKYFFFIFEVSFFIFDFYKLFSYLLRCNPLIVDKLLIKFCWILLICRYDRQYKQQLRGTKRVPSPRQFTLWCYQLNLQGKQVKLVNECRIIWKIYLT